MAARLRGPDLTDREVDITRLVVAGKTNKEIGASLKITEGTVKVHIRAVTNKGKVLHGVRTYHTCVAGHHGSVPKL